MEIVKLGQTVEHNGQVVLVTDGDMPADCLVLFVSRETWGKIKGDIQVIPQDMGGLK